MTAEKNEEMPKAIRNTDDLYWFIEHSDVFKYHMLSYGARILLEERDLIRKDVQHERKVRKEEE